MMPALSIERMLKQLLDVEHHLDTKRATEAPPAPPLPVVAMGHDFGAGGEDIGRALAQRLGVQFFGDDLSQRPQDRLHLEDILLHRLDELGRRRTHSQDLLAFLGGSPTTMPTYRRQLVEALLLIAEREGGVIVDRGSHVFLQDRPILRVRLTGSLERRAQRVAERESVALDEARRKIERIDHERMNYLHALLGRHMFDHQHFDLVVNTDRVKHPQDAADMLVKAMQAMELPIALPRGDKA
ncbi:MAG: cytidylate kinase-like family protein [Halothiobacillaceae bacterium]|nr:MAG: cytidylate kinase-like family protein [Halothiobacillaceae bacterium]